MPVLTGATRSYLWIWVTAPDLRCGLGFNLPIAGVRVRVWVRVRDRVTQLRVRVGVRVGVRVWICSL